MIKWHEQNGLITPGGPQVDRLAAEGEDTYSFPRVWLDKDEL